MQLREAHEEVGLPLDSPHVHQLCVLRPFLSVSQLLVVPVVALLTNLDVLADLVPCVEEVDHIFDHPLEAILDPSLMAAAVATDEEPLVVKGTKHWPYPQDFYVSPVLVLDRSAPREKCYRLSFSPVKQNTSDVVAVAYDDILYRMHRFRTCASPIKGLTADILVSTSFPLPLTPKRNCVFGAGEIRMVDPRSRTRVSEEDLVRPVSA